MIPADQSGKRPAISDRQAELDREALEIVHAFVRGYRAEQLRARRERYLRIALWVLSIAALVAFVLRMSTWRSA